MVENATITTQELIDYLNEPQGPQVQIGLTAAMGIRDRLIAAQEMAKALAKCREYLTHSLGSTSEVNPYPDMENALANWRKVTGEAVENANGYVRPRRLRVRS